MIEVRFHAGGSTGIAIDLKNANRALDNMLRVWGGGYCDCPQTNGQAYHACTLLVSTDMNMADIASEVGFGSTQTFFRVFKLVKGGTPGSYRRRRTVT